MFEVVVCQCCGSASSDIKTSEDDIGMSSNELIDVTRNDGKILQLASCVGQSHARVFAESAEMLAEGDVHVEG